MEIFEIISLIIITIYGFVFSILIYGFLLKKRVGEVMFDLVPISVIIPFRNEEENLKNLIQSFNNLNYNLNIVEFIFIDDHSTDASYALLSTELKKTALIYKIIMQSDNKVGKKQAIETAINNAKNEFIVTTDADSIPSKKWLKEYAFAFQKGNQFIIGPVINKSSTNFIGKIHSIEALMLSGVTMGSASLNQSLICSGANLGYTKSLFQELQPYKSNSSLPSGDDVFFLDAVKQNQQTISYLKSHDALVYTQAHSSYTGVLSQAIRWSSKNGQMTQKLNLYFSILIFITNILVLPCFVFAVLGSSICFMFVCSKLLIDTLFFFVSATFYKQLKLIFYTPFIYFFYPIHLMVIFVSSLFVQVQWKGRSIVTNEKQQ